MFFCFSEDVEEDACPDIYHLSDTHDVYHMDAMSDDKTSVYDERTYYCESESGLGSIYAHPASIYSMVSVSQPQLSHPTSSPIVPPREVPSPPPPPPPPPLPHMQKQLLVKPELHVAQLGAGTSTPPTHLDCDSAEAKFQPGTKTLPHPSKSGLEVLETDPNIDCKESCGPAVACGARVEDSSGQLGPDQETHVKRALSEDKEPVHELGLLKPEEDFPNLDDRSSESKEQQGGGDPVMVDQGARKRAKSNHVIFV